MNKNIFMGLIFVGILAGAVGTGITEGLGAGFSVFGGVFGYCCHSMVDFC